MTIREYIDSQDESKRPRLNAVYYTIRFSHAYSYSSRMFAGATPSACGNSAGRLSLVSRHQIAGLSPHWEAKRN